MGEDLKIISDFAADKPNEMEELLSQGDELLKNAEEEATVSVERALETFDIFENGLSEAAGEEPEKTEAEESGEPEEEPAGEPEEAGTEEPEESADPAEPAEEAEDGEEHTKVFSVENLSEQERKLEGVNVVSRLCRAVMEAVGEDGFHGGVRPDNISLSGDTVALGSMLEHGVGEFTPQELEYMAPELFWDGKRSSAADVYSIGLVLYSLYNHARMPFWPEEEDASPNARASALQKRMSREAVPAPVGAGEELAAIIQKALAFTAEERYGSVAELREALESCAEKQADPADLAQIMAAMSVRAGKKDRKNEPVSPFVGDVEGEEDDAPVPEEEEEPIPRVKVRRTRRRLGQILVYAVLAASIVAIVLLLRRCAALDEQARVTPTPPAVEAMQPSEQEKIINGNLSEQLPESQTGETPETTPAPVETETTPAPAEAEPIVEYTAYRENVSWNEAVQRCKDMGGTLAMPTNYAEFQEITAACENAGLTFVWLNCRRDENDVWVNADGEANAYFYAWGDGEPSYSDKGDGVAENYFLLWNMGGRWSGNDSREDPLDGYWNSYAGRIGFVCKTVSYPLPEDG